MIQNGIINLLKPAGMTSHDGVQFLRRLTGIKRIGHTGTLDPMAVGVLPLCIGSTARINEYLEMDFKHYRCEMKLGVQTDTQDIWGTVISENQNRVSQITEHDLMEAFEPFRGFISQMPPDYSAVRINGKRLYEYARQGEEIKAKTRQVYIKNITVNNVNLRQGIVCFDVECSKGTYIRTICNDIGRILGCGAVMSCLIRTASGAFSLENSVTMEELSEDGAAQYLLKTDFPLVHFGKAVIKENRKKWFVNGGHLRLPEALILREPEYQNGSHILPVRSAFKTAYNIYEQQNPQNGVETFLGVAFYREDLNMLVPDKIFYNEREEI